MGSKDQHSQAWTFKYHTLFLPKYKFQIFGIKYDWGKNGFTQLRRIHPLDYVLVLQHIAIKVGEAKKIFNESPLQVVENVGQADYFGEVSQDGSNTSNIKEMLSMGRFNRC
jgi:hypothetical protein